MSFPVILALLLVACGDKDAAPDDTAADSGTSDGGTSDGGASDGGASDGGTTDGGTSDGGTSDGGTSDGGTGDGGTSDGGTSDGGTGDGGTGDGGTGDGGTGDGGTGDGGTGDGGTGDGGTSDGGASEKTWYQDLDGDGHGNPDVVASGASAPDGYVPDPGDCDDEDDTVHPDADEVCGDGVDNDCDGEPAACMAGALDRYDAVRTLSTSGDLGFGRYLWGGDLDGDGTQDLLLGADDEDRIYTALGPFDADLEDPDAFTADFGLTTTGARFAEAFVAGDFDGDGTVDLAAGAHQVSDEGGVWLLYDVGAATGSIDLDIDADVAISGDDDTPQVGGAVLALDHDGDGFDDLVVVSTPPGGSASSDGFAFLLYGSETRPDSELELSSAADVVITFDDSVPYDIVTGPDGIATLGDVDGDGLPELALSAEPDSHDHEDAATLVFFGAADRLAASLLPGDADAILMDASSTDRRELGYVGAAGDMDGDGHADVLVADPSYDLIHSSEGEVFLVDGASSLSGAVDVPSVASLTVQGEETGDQLGIELDSGDYDGDGQRDLALGCHVCNRVGDTWAGSTAVFFGPVSGVLVLSDVPSHITASTFAAYGSRETVSGDYTGDGVDDLVVSAFGVGSVLIFADGL